jgi:hypothetical protein
MAAYRVTFTFTRLARSGASTAVLWGMCVLCDVYYVKVIKLKLGHTSLYVTLV